MYLRTQCLIKKLLLNPYAVQKIYPEKLILRLRSHSIPARPNLMLQSYLKSDNPAKTLWLFFKLFRKNTSSIDSYSLLYVIKACAKRALDAEGNQLHVLVIKLGYDSVIFLQTSLLEMYSAAANLSDAARMFDEMSQKNVVSWTSLISAYVGNQKPNKALQIFRKMQMENVEPDQVTLTVALSACADLGALDMGECIHAYVCGKEELDADLHLKNSLINMYAKCGDIRAANDLFQEIRDKDVMTWTSMIVGYALNGQTEEALRTFAAMKDEKKSLARKRCRLPSHMNVPNEVTFVGVLMACSHGGLVEEGQRQFMSMIKEYGLKPRLSHYGCMVDLFCRCGLLKEAYDFVLAMPIKPNAVIWRTLLAASGIHGDTGLAALAHQRLLELEENLVGDDVVLSNIYAGQGRWDEKAALRDEMKQRRIPGCSTIEVGSCSYQFVSADNDHPLANEITKPFWKVP